VSSLQKGKEHSANLIKKGEINNDFTFLYLCMLQLADRVSVSFCMPFALKIAANWHGFSGSFCLDT
jgi:hypothetical protein